jgi:hypothetical protein
MQVGALCARAARPRGPRRQDPLGARARCRGRGNGHASETAGSGPIAPRPFHPPPTLSASPYLFRHNGRGLQVLQEVTQERVMCYWWRLVWQYSRILKAPPNKTSVRRASCRFRWQYLATRNRHGLWMLAGSAVGPGCRQTLAALRICNHQLSMESRVGQAEPLPRLPQKKPVRELEAEGRDSNSNVASEIAWYCGLRRSD